MLFFAGNSLLCRLALATPDIDGATFTLVRLASGAAILAVLVALRRDRSDSVALRRGSWPAAIALLVYAAGFSAAYRSLTAGAGAFVLFASVQATMIAIGTARGARPTAGQLAGMAVALAGLFLLVAPVGGPVAAPPGPAALMALAGAAWGVYSIAGRGAADPLGATAGNFARATPLAVLLLLAALAAGLPLHADTRGLASAIASGAITSGLGYTLWYAVLPALSATVAASVQLAVPVIAALGGAALLGEALSLRLLAASAAILGGIALVLANPRHPSR